MPECSRSEAKIMEPALDDDKDTVPLEIPERHYGKKHGRKGLKLS